MKSREHPPFTWRTPMYHLVVRALVPEGEIEEKEEEDYYPVYRKAKQEDSVWLLEMRALSTGRRDGRAVYGVARMTSEMSREEVRMTVDNLVRTLEYYATDEFDWKSWQERGLGR